MSLKDLLLALCVIIAWGVNFVVIKLGLHTMPPFLLAGLRFTLVAFPALFFVKPPQISLRWLVTYGMTISFGQFAFLFLAISIGMPAGVASLVIQAQAFFTILSGALILGEKLKWNHIIGILISAAGMILLAVAGTNGIEYGGVTPITMMLTLAAALSWGLGNITNKVIMLRHPVPVMSLVVWSALIPIVPFFICSWFFEGKSAITYSLIHIHAETILALVYLAFIATIASYAIWSILLSRYETWRIAPLSLLVPVVAILCSALFLGEQLSSRQLTGALIIILGLLVNIFGSSLASGLRISRQ
ncbi:O-acetylserine/cysteine exporter [Salmonella enterica]|uniref:O-acetylserine/cysteine exporter n=1 Tax=Salmonella enterica TaxID=28901 RepID=A0A5T8B9F8_SALER|nr:O-acetylserine/cysteine exporter [Salmonella enterica]EBN4400447.1 O-acetylserine/cysteine exporter [Salmonella enterica]EGC1081696.1 EamA family transporter [Salmonella enterica]EGK1570519.1 EamA family transporter [Salmonella enterica]